MKRKRYVEAETHYRRAADLYPDNVVLREKLGTVKVKLGELEAAAAIFQEILDVYPGDIWVANRLADAFRFLDRFADAKQLLSRSLAKHPRSSRLRIMALFFDCLPEDNPEIQQALCGELPNYSSGYYPAVSTPPGFTFARKSIAYNNFTSELVNVVNNRRITTGQPGSYAKTIHILGSSQVYSSCNEDGHTIVSQVQQKCNSSASAPIRVVNRGVGGQMVDHALIQVLTIEMAPGDIVVVAPLLEITTQKRGNFEEVVSYIREIEKVCRSRGAHFFVTFFPTIFLMKNPSKRELDLQRMTAGKFWLGRYRARIRKNRAKLLSAVEDLNVRRIDMEDILDRPHTLGEIFVDWEHFNYRANHLMADAMYRQLAPVLTADAPAPAPHSPNRELKMKAIQKMQKTALDHFSTKSDIIAWVKEARHSDFDGCGKIGAVVMNCNPFTYGHQHLVRQAASMVDGLYVFVVEEDKSFFRFSDRFAMVSRGVADIGGRIHVVPSGKFIISSFSFAEYFAKEEAVTPPDPTVDVVLFGSVIAHSLRITHRFVGEEPFCLTTNEYNDTMMFLLPDMGVEMHVIPRLENDREAISATAARRALRDNDMDTLRRLTPPTTMEILVQGKYIGHAE